MSQCSMLNPTIPRSRTGRLGKGDREPAPLPGDAIDPDPPAHERDERLGDRETDAEAAVLEVDRLVGLGEGLEDPVALLGRDAYARVLHVEEDLVVVRAAADRDLALLRELE